MPEKFGHLTRSVFVYFICLLLSVIIIALSFLRLSIILKYIHVQVLRYTVKLFNLMGDDWPIIAITDDDQI